MQMNKIYSINCLAALGAENFFVRVVHVTEW